MLKFSKNKGENDISKLPWRGIEGGKKDKICKTGCMKLKHWHKIWNFCFIDSDKHLLNNYYGPCTMLSINGSKDE